MMAKRGERCRRSLKIQKMQNARFTTVSAIAEPSSRHHPRIAEFPGREART